MRHLAPHHFLPDGTIKNEALSLTKYIWCFAADGTSDTHYQAHACVLSTL